MQVDSKKKLMVQIILTEEEAHLLKDFIQNPPFDPTSDLNDHEFKTSNFLGHLFASLKEELER